MAISFDNEQQIQDSLYNEELMHVRTHTEGHFYFSKNRKRFFLNKGIFENVDGFLLEKTILPKVYEIFDVKCPAMPEEGRGAEGARSALLNSINSF